MKKLSKVIAVTTVAAMSFACLSSYAADMSGKSGSMSFHPTSARMEMKTDAGTSERENGKFGGRINGRGMKGEMPARFEMTEEEKAAKLEELKDDLAAKLEAGKITQEKYDEVIAAIEAGEFMRGGKGGRGMKGKIPEKIEITEEEKAAKLEEFKTNFAAKHEAGEFMRGSKDGRHKAPGMNKKTDNADNTSAE